MSKFTVNEVTVLSVCFYYIHYRAITCGLFTKLLLWENQMILDTQVVKTIIEMSVDVQVIKTYV